MPCLKAGHFGAQCQLPINQVEGRLIATSGTFFHSQTA